jgi:hypothetical protein
MTLMLLAVGLSGCINEETRSFSVMQEKIGETHTIIGYISNVYKMSLPYGGDDNYQGQIYDMPLEQTPSGQYYTKSEARMVYIEFSPSVNVEGLHTNTHCKLTGNVISDNEMYITKVELI